MPGGAVLADLALPPTSLAVIALLAVLVGGRPMRVVAIGALVLLVALSLPVVAIPLLGSLDVPDRAPDRAPACATPGAIVVLSGDTELTRDPGGVDIGALTLERQRRAAALHRETGLPILVTGGVVNAPPPVASLMAASLAEDFNVPVRWIETESRDTWENAVFSAGILRASGIDCAYIVTHAWHMPRSLYAFDRAGFPGLPAPVRREPALRQSPGLVMPRVTAWRRSYYALHEWVGLLAYRMR